MEIKLEKYQCIQEKLATLKCSQGCQSPANYIIFELGLLCTLCLSKIGEVPKQRLASLEQLAKIIADMTETYQKNSKNGPNMLSLKAEIEQNKKTINGLRDNLSSDAKTLKSKAKQQIDNIHNHCYQQFRNEPLQNFFEPDISVSMYVKQSELFLANLRNLKVIDQNGKISYAFKQPEKNPEEAKKLALKQIGILEGIVSKSHGRVKAIMDKFKSSIKQ